MTRTPKLLKLVELSSAQEEPSAGINYGTTLEHNDLDNNVRFTKYKIES